MKCRAKRKLKMSSSPAFFFLFCPSSGQLHDPDKHSAMAIVSIECSTSLLYIFFQQVLCFGNLFKITSLSVWDQFLPLIWLEKHGEKQLFHSFLICNRCYQICSQSSFCPTVLVLITHGCIAFFTNVLLSLAFLDY